jgi:GTPase SAR1 family protein
MTSITKSEFVSSESLTNSVNLELPRKFHFLRYGPVSAIGQTRLTTNRIKLVVVGDQSSGKSSLLEGLTGLSFPVASDLCTRFATQIVLRRAPADEAGVKITIIPGPSAQANENVKESLLGFERNHAVDEFGNEEFARIFNEVGLD